MAIVQTNTEYTYEKLKTDLKNLKEKYQFLEIGSIGISILQRNIWGIKIGKGNKKIFYSGAIHANEWITTVLLMKFLENYAQAYQTGGKIYGYNAVELYNTASLYIVPMVNPDGVELVTGGLQNVENQYKKFENIAKEFPQIPFPNGWKANANGMGFFNFQLQKLYLVILILFYK